MRTSPRDLLPLLVLCATPPTVLLLLTLLAGHAVPVVFTPTVLLGWGRWRPMLAGLLRRLTAAARSAAFQLALLVLLLVEIGALVFMVLTAPNTVILVAASLLAPALILAGFGALPGGSFPATTYSSSDPDTSAANDPDASDASDASDAD